MMPLVSSYSQQRKLRHIVIASASSQRGRRNKIMISIRAEHTEQIHRRQYKESTFPSAVLAFATAYDSRYDLKAIRADQFVTILLGRQSIRKSQYHRATPGNLYCTADTQFDADLLRGSLTLKGQTTQSRRFVDIIDVTCP